MIFYVFDIGILLVWVVLAVMMLVGLSESIVSYIADNLGSVIVICVVLTLIYLVITLLYSKNLWVALFSIAFTSQFFYLFVYGIYEISLKFDAHPFRSFLLLFIFGMYILGQMMLSLKLLEMQMDFGSKNDLLDFDGVNIMEINGDVMCQIIVFGIIGVVGWLINWWVLF